MPWNAAASTPDSFCLRNAVTSPPPAIYVAHLSKLPRKAGAAVFRLTHIAEDEVESHLMPARLAVH